ncbi:MAG: zf-HC2 domain-containing protein [Burkholderiales bacterium]
MNGSNCKTPIEFSALIEYWLDELDEAAEARIDEHLLGCGECSERLDEIIALAGGIRTAFAQGSVRAFLTVTFAKRLAERGVRVREYRVPRNGSVNCTVAPEDEVMIGRLEAPLAGVSRLDAISYPPATAPEVFRDIPFDAASGEVVLAPKIENFRAMPAHEYRVRLIAVDTDGKRVIGDYTFNHKPQDSLG